MDNKEQMNELKKAIGITAEMALLFHRAILKAGATSVEARQLSQAYIGALIYGNQKKPAEGE